MNATCLWSLWQEILLSLACGFATYRGQQRFVEWTTGLVLNVEEHTITQSLVGLDRVGDWKGLESFAETGHWDLRRFEWGLARQLDRLPNRIWHGYQVWSGDDTKVHRTSPHVWGTCTFHEYTARCPNRASTVRAHNWVVVGALVPHVEQPCHFLPTAGRLYFRESQLPAPGRDGVPVVFQTKCQLLVELLRGQARGCRGKPLGVFDGGFALGSVVRPLVRPEDPAQPRIDFLTRLRRDARLHALPEPRRPGQRGRTPKWGRKLSPPKQGGRWPGAWREGRAFLYGRARSVRYKEVVGLWRVLGAETPVKAVVAEVEDYSERFTLVGSALDLSGVQMVEIFCGRFQQENGFRDLKQRLGWEECRAWTRAPIERTTQAVMAAMTAMRLLQYELQRRSGEEWWLKVPWNPHKSRASVLDVERLFWGHREGIQRCLAEWLENGGKSEA